MIDEFDNLPVATMDRDGFDDLPVAEQPKPAPPRASAGPDPREAYRSHRLKEIAKEKGGNLLALTMNPQVRAQIDSEIDNIVKVASTQKQRRQEAAQAAQKRLSDETGGNPALAAPGRFDALLGEERLMRQLPIKEGEVDNSNVGHGKTVVEQWADRLQSGAVNLATSAVGLAAPEFANRHQKVLNDVLQSDPRYKGSFLHETLPEVIGGAAPLALATGASAGAGITAGVAAGAGSQRMDAREHGAGGWAELAATLGGGALGATEAIPLLRGLNRMNKAGGGSLFKQMAKNGVQQGVEEFAQNWAQRLGSDGLAKMLYDFDREISLAPTKEDAAGAVVGFAIGSIGTPIAQRLRKGEITKDQAASEFASAVAAQAPADLEQSASIARPDFNLPRPVAPETYAEVPPYQNHVARIQDQLRQAESRNKPTGPYEVGEATNEGIDLEPPPLKEKPYKVGKEAPKPAYAPTVPTSGFDRATFGTEQDEFSKMLALDSLAQPSTSAEAGGVFSSFLKGEEGAVSLESMIQRGEQIARGVGKGVRAAGQATGRGIYDFADLVSGQQSNATGKTEPGKQFIQILDDEAAKADTLTGKAVIPLQEGWNKLTHEDKKWLDAPAEEGFQYSRSSNIQRLTENIGRGKLQAPNARIQAWADNYQKFLDITADEAIAKGIQTERDGELGLFAARKEGAWLRQQTPEYQQAIRDGSGEVFEAAARAIAERPLNRMTQEQAVEYLEEQGKPKSERKSGSLERGRVIVDMPTHALGRDGKSWIQLLETHPLEGPKKAANTMARRIYLGSRLGQGLKGEKTGVEKLRAAHVAAGGDAKDFDNSLAGYYKKPMRESIFNPRNQLLGVGRVVDAIASSLHLSASAIPGVFQPLMTTQYVAAKPWFQGLKRAFTDYRATKAWLVGIGAAHYRAMDWSLKWDSFSTDLSRIIKDVSSRVFLHHWVNLWNEVVAGAQFNAMVDYWQANGFDPNDVQTLKHLRLNEGEIAAVKAGQITPEIRNKIVQNGVKITQFSNEENYRKSRMQLHPLTNWLVAYNSYPVGTMKNVARAMDSLKGGLATLKKSKGKDWDRFTRAGGQTLALIGGLAGAGMLARALTSVSKGEEPFKDDENRWDMFGKALWQSAILGPSQRVVDALDYSYNVPEKAAIGLFPRVSFLVDFILRAPMSDKFDTWDAMVKNTPALKRLLKVTGNAEAPPRERRERETIERERR